MDLGIFQLPGPFVVQSISPDSLLPHGLQYARLPCPSLSPRVFSNSCPLSQWCYPTTSSSVVPFSSQLQSFPASRSFQMSQFFALLWWPKYWSFSFSISSCNEYSGLISFRMNWLDLLSVQGTLKSLLQHCRGPAPANPGYSKRRRRWQPIYLFIHQRYNE